jgi:hypothetical protein
MREDDWYRARQRQHAEALRATTDPQAQAQLRDHMVRFAADRNYREHWRNTHEHFNRMDTTLRERGISSQEIPCSRQSDRA